MNDIKLGIYRHTKTKDSYLVLGIFTETETLEKYVAYVGMSGAWIRPLKSFLSEIEIQGRLVPRFLFQKSVTAGKIGQVLLDDGKI